MRFIASFIVQNQKGDKEAPTYSKQGTSCARCCEQNFCFSLENSEPIFERDIQIDIEGRNGKVASHKRASRTRTGRAEWGMHFYVREVSRAEGMVWPGFIEPACTAYNTTVCPAPPRTPPRIHERSHSRTFAVRSGALATWGSAVDAEIGERGPRG